VGYVSDRVLQFTSAALLHFVAKGKSQTGNLLETKQFPTDLQFGIEDADITFVVDRITDFSLYFLFHSVGC
jgi:hypothetical protein